MNSHIILIDDNSADNVLHEKIIRSVHKDANISIIDSGEEALRYLRRKFDATKELDAQITVFLDEKMPDRDGLDLLSELEERELEFPEAVSIYFLTNDTSVRLIEKAGAHANVREVIHKPLTTAKIEGIVF